MLLKRIVLKNIRSYKEQEIFFTEGSTLLSGDIGSGKTSVLLAIEFALFGLQPGQKAISLLRNDAKLGGVEMEFEVNGKNVLIERTLKRGKTISQDYSAITVEGIKQEISVTELKNIVLDLLNYPMEFSKRQNILYKFTVYTPQEEMKQIILQDPETRINTLRHIFGIDKYKRILENTSIVASKIREEQRIKEALIANLEQDKLSLVEKEEELESKHFNLLSVEKELFLKIEKRKQIQDEKQEVEKNIQEKRKLEQEIEKTKIMFSNKKDAFTVNEKTLKTLKEQIQELSKQHFDESQIENLEKEIQAKNQKKEEVNEINLRIASRINSLLSKNDDNESLRKKLSNLEICPTCLQDVDTTYRVNVLNELDSNTSKNKKEINALNEEKQLVLNKLKELNLEVSLLEKQLQELKILKVKLQQIQEKRDQVLEIEKSNANLMNDINMLKKHVEVLENSVSGLEELETMFLKKQKELEIAFNEEKQAEIKVAELKKEIAVFSKQIDDFKEKIKKTEDIKKNLAYIVALENWLSKNFSNLVSFIERNVLSKLKSDFSELFSKWFAMLVSDNFNVFLDDNFTPRVEQQDYEIDYQYLSGGERTAIALAYRLALNQVINSLLSKINTKDFVVLDEPTDGFSEQQLDKMREVLDQLNVAQLILVSHEQKIEGFVENIIRFKKENGVTRAENQNI